MSGDARATVIPSNQEVARERLHDPDAAAAAAAAVAQTLRARRAPLPYIPTYLGSQRRSGFYPHTTGVEL